MKTILEQIYDFADEAHRDQLRKDTPDRYMVHPRRVMELCQSVTSEEEVLAAALLHDVLEDTNVQAAELFNFLRRLMEGQRAEKTLNLVIELTDVYVKSNYPKLNRRERKTKEATRMQSISAEAQTIK